MKLQRALLISVITLLLTSDHIKSYSSTPCRIKCPPFIPGAVAYWPMTLKTNGSDLSGNDNHATFVGLTYTDGPTSNKNGAVHFSGSSNSYAKVRHSSSMNVGKYPGFSFSGFVRLGSQHKSASLIDWSGRYGYGVFVVATAEQVIQLHLYPSNRDTMQTAPFPEHKLIKGSWHFIGLSYDKATGNATAFKDGQLEVKQLDKDISAGSDKTGEVGLGVDLSDTDFHYNGDMSCMMLFKFALTADDFERVWRFCRTINLTQTILPSITVSDISTSSAIASWTKSPGIFSGYKITMESKQGEMGQEIVHPTFISSSAKFPESVFTGLVPCETYRVRVWHMQGDIKGRARSSTWFDTKQSLVVESDSITITEITATSANVSWNDVTGNYDGYSVDISPATGEAKADPSTVPKGKATTFLKNLSPGTHYIIKIRATIGGKKTCSSTRSFQTPAAAAAAAADTAAANATGSTIAATTAAVISLVVSVIVLIVIIVIVFKFKANNQPKRPNKEMKNHDDPEDTTEPMIEETTTEMNNPNDPGGTYVNMLERNKPAQDKDLLTHLKKDLKKRYEGDYCTLFMLPYRPDRANATTELSRNFEEKTQTGYTTASLYKMLEESDGKPNSKRYVLEGLAGDGRTVIMKQLAYKWATGHESLNRLFEFIFLINADDFVQFKANAKKPTSNILGDFVSSDNFFSDQGTGSCSNLSSKIWPLVEARKGNVLFIIDTNYMCVLPEDLIPLLSRKIMRDSTVILTCRTNQVPAEIRAYSNEYTFIRITKHPPDTIRKHILKYSESKGESEMGNCLLQNLGIMTTDDNGITIWEDVKLSWITTPFMLLIVINVWHDIWEAGNEDEKKSFSLDKPYIYQKVVKNIFKRYECYLEEFSYRVNHTAEEHNFAQEMLTLGRFAWDMIREKNSSIPVEKLGPVKDGEANVLRNIPVLQPIMIPVDGIAREEYSFTDEIWKFYFAARFLRDQKDKNEIDDKAIQDAVEIVRKLNKNIDGLFQKIIELPM